MQLQDYRLAIDRVDDELVHCFVKRMELSAQIAAYKREHGLPVRDAEREREKLASVGEMLPPELKDSGAAFFETILRLSRERQERILGGEA